MLALAATLLALAGPPPATAGGGRLAVSSWCWGARCGAPIAASARTIHVARGSTVRVQLTFEPAQVQLAVAGARQTTAVHGHEVEWRARRAGGFTLRVTSTRGWVIYVGRLAVS